MTLYPKGERALQVCQSLTDRIGPRPLGSATNQAASDYIYQQFLEMGLAPARQLFVCPEWISLGVSLQVNGKPLPAVVNSFSPPCDIEAGLSPISSLPELERVDLSDQIAVLYGDLTQGTGYSVRSAFYFPEKDQQVFNILEDKRPAAVITVHSKPGGNERLIRDWQFPIPSITVPADIGLELLLGYRCHAHLQIQSNRVGGVQPGTF